MIKNKNYNGVGIRIIFTLISLLLTITFIAPIFSMLPGIAIEKTSKLLINNYPYSNVGRLTVLLLAGIYVLLWIFSVKFLKKTVVKNRGFSKGRIIILMILHFFLVHSLSYYILWGIDADFRIEKGQFIFGAIKSHLIGSCAFIFIGLTIDLIKNKAISRLE